MGFHVSVVLEDLGWVDPEGAGREVHGANLSISAQLKEYGRREEVESLEVFVPPKFIGDRGALEAWANHLLPQSRRGRGVLRILPVTSLPEVWADGKERIHWVKDPWWLARERYLRDRFAVGPTPIMVDTHSLGQHDQNETLAQLRGLPRVEYDTLCALTTPVAEAYRRIFEAWLTPGVEPPFRIKILPHSVDVTKFQPASASVKSVARQSFSLPEDVVIGMYFGRITPNSKADLLPLIHAFDQVSASNRHMVIAGIENIPGYVARLQKEVEARGLKDRVHFLPPVSPSMRHLVYAAADFFVFPGDTVQEALGNTMLEAAASGLPTLTSDWDGMAAVSVHGSTGIHVPCFWMPCQEKVGSLLPILPKMTAFLLMAQSVWIDVDRLAEGMDGLYRDEVIRKSYGENGRKLMETSFSTDRIWDMTTALWSEALEMARREQSDVRENRRRHAQEHGLGMPVLDIFSHYATGVIDRDRDAVSLTAYGEACLSGAKELTFYDECLPLINPQSIGALRGLAWTRPHAIRAVADQMCQKSGGSMQDSLLLIAFLLKRGVFVLAKSE